MDPMTWTMAAGAAAGAMMDDDNPMRGAMMGGALGGVGGAALGGAGALGGQAAAGGGAGLYGALPGMAGAAVPGSQAAMLGAQTAGMGLTQAEMLAAQTADFGAGGLLATGEAAAVPGSMTQGAFGAGRGLAFGGDGNSANMIKAGQAIGKMGGQPPPQQQRPMPMMPPPQQQQRQGGQFKSPYQNQGQPNSYAYGQPSLLPGFRR